MSDQVQEVPAGDKVSWVANGSELSSTAAINPSGLPVTVVAAQPGDGPTKMPSDDLSPAAHAETNGNGVAKPADDLKPSAPELNNKNGDVSEGGSINENKEEQKADEQAPKEPEVAKVEDKKDEITPAQANQEEPQTGDKRNTDEKADAREPTDIASTNDAKKQKLDTNGTAPTNGEKKKPGRPKGSGSGAAKKDKKIPVVGRAQRKTRSQGTTEN